MSAGTSTVRSTKASRKMPKLSPIPKMSTTRSPASRNPANTVIMTTAAAVMMPPVSACPTRTERRVVAGEQPLLVHAGDEEDLVVHRQPEQDREEDHRDERVDRSAGADADQPRKPAPLEDRDDDAEAGTGGEQVHDRRGERQHETAEGDHQQQERQPDDGDEEQRHLVGDHLGEVDLDGGLPEHVDVVRRPGLERGHRTARSDWTSCVVASSCGRCPVLKVIRASRLPSGTVPTLPVSTSSACAVSATAAWRR